MKSTVKQWLLCGGVFFRLIVTETACCKYVRSDTVVEHQQALSSLASHPPSVGSIWTFPVEPSIYLRPSLIPHHLPKIHKRYPTMGYPVSGSIAYACICHVDSISDISIPNEMEHHSLEEPPLEANNEFFRTSIQSRSHLIVQVNSMMEPESSCAPESVVIHRPWKNGWLEDDPFLWGENNCSGANC